MFVIAYPNNDDTYDLLDTLFASVKEAVVHAKEYLAEWVDYVVMPVGKPVYTYTWDDNTGVAKIETIDKE